VRQRVHVRVAQGHGARQHRPAGHWIRIGPVDAAVLDLLALGAEVEVLQPPELRSEMRRAGRLISSLHTGPGCEPAAELSERPLNH
jgi:predicted DNA-binding transcriptional regulator YafY